MKERPASEEVGWGAASAPLRCVGLRSATAALGSNCSSVSGAKGLQESLATFRRKNAFSEIGRVTLHATDIVFGGDFARVHSCSRGEWTVPA
jgi:hypothetical protein